MHLMAEQGKITIVYYYFVKLSILIIVSWVNMHLDHSLNASDGFFFTGHTVKRNYELEIFCYSL